MNFLGGSKAAQRTRPTPATALRIQSSVNGTPRPFGYGQARIAANLLWTGNFTPVFVPSAGGGKGGLGGGGKSGGGGSYIYYTGVIFGLCEGPIDSIQQVWANKTGISAVAAQTPGSGADLGFSYFDGDYQQLPWSWLAANVPSAAQNFRGIAYAATESFQLGTTPELPNMTFDVRFAISGAVAEFFTVPTSPYQLTPLYFDWDYGVAVQFMIPNAAPYTYDFGNTNSDTNLVTQSGLASGINPNDTAWAPTNGAGVIWGDGATNGTPGQPLTKTTGTPSTGQYTVTPGAYAGNGVVWGFAAADAGQPVTIIAAAVSPGVYYAEAATMTLTAGSATAAAISAPALVPVGAQLSAPGFLAEGTFVQGVTGGSATGTTSSGSATLSSTAGSFIAGAGTPISDSLGAIPGGTTVLSTTQPSVTAGGGATSALTATGVAFTASFATTGQQSGNQITVASAAGIAPGSQVVVPVQRVYFYPVTANVLSVVGTTVTLDTATGYTGPANDSFTFTTEFTGDVTTGSATIANPSSLAGLSTSSTLTDAIGAFSQSGVSVSAVTQGAIVISANATANETGDLFSFGATALLSSPALKSGASVAVTVRGKALTQVLSSPAAGQFTLSVQAATFGTYTFNSADAGKPVLIIDKPDANPADVVVDFLTNPYYGMTQFPLSRIGDLSAYRAYCLAEGLLVSPTITTPGAASQFLQDLMSATNAEMVWSGGLLTIVPYGDATITGNGATFTPNLTPLYSLDDDDFLDNQGSNPKSAASFASDDPVQVTRLDIYDQDNDIKVEYLDRAGAYNPTIVEAKDDAAIALFGLKNSGSRQLHLFCDESAALQSAQLMLGRTQVLRTFSFTVGREFILLDPMDIVEITDSGAGLVNQPVRLTEITENQDRSLSITGEEVLAGAGSAPRYGRQKSLPPTTSFNVPAPDALAPLFFDAPVQLGNVLGMETVLCTGGTGNFGGCDIWVASDNVNFKFAGTLWGGTAMGTITATFGSGSDPDTTNTLSVDLTSSGGALTGGTQADADAGHTLCLVDGELVTYEQATLTAAGKYDLGKSGSTPGYLRRGFYGTTIASHATNAPFARLRPGSYFTLGYGAPLVGSTIYVKLLAFNRYGGGKQTLDQVSSYSHTLAAPPVLTSGLLANIIQTPDISFGAATQQITANVDGPVTFTAAGYTTIVTATLPIFTEPSPDLGPPHMTGGTMQVAVNCTVINNKTTGGDTVGWELHENGLLFASGSLAILASSSITFTRQYARSLDGVVGTSMTYDLKLTDVTNVTPSPTAINADISLTQIIR